MCIIFPHLLPVYSRYWACLINLGLIQLNSTSYFKIFCVFLCWPHDCCLLNPFLVSCYRHQNFARDLILSLCSLFSSVIKSSAIHQRFVFCRAFWSQLPFFSQGRVSMKSYDLRINVMALCRKHSRKLFWFSVSIWGVLWDFLGGNPLFLLK